MHTKLKTIKSEKQKIKSASESNEWLKSWKQNLYSSLLSSDGLITNIITNYNQWVQIIVFSVYAKKKQCTSNDMSWRIMLSCWWQAAVEAKKQ